MINYSKDHTTADTLDYTLSERVVLAESGNGSDECANAEKRPGDFVPLPGRQKSFGSQ